MIRRTFVDADEHVTLKARHFASVTRALLPTPTYPRDAVVTAPLLDAISKAAHHLYCRGDERHPSHRPVPGRRHRCVDDRRGSRQLSNHRWAELRWYGQRLSSTTHAARSAGCDQAPAPRAHRERRARAALL